MYQPPSLIEYALDSIRTNIQNGTYPPQYKLSTQEISDKLGISRTPVIAAINRLVAEGLAESIPRRGTIVTQLTPKKIREMCDVRTMIESYAATKAIDNLDSKPEVLEEMKSLADFFSSMEIQDYDYDGLSQLDQKFHTLLVSLADNEQLLSMYRGNWSIGTPYYILRLARVPLSSIKKQLKTGHNEFVTFLVNKDRQGLLDSLNKHLHEIERIVADILKENPGILESKK